MTANLQPKRVLIVDDEVDIQEVAKTSLEMTAGWEVETASSGAEGIEAASRRQFDAILLDYMMPGTDGASTFDSLRATPQTANIPVIFLTAKVQRADRQRIAQLGARGIIAKPFDPMELAREVSNLLGWDG